jgi:hypothetical protein
MKKKIDEKPWAKFHNTKHPTNKRGKKERKS